MNNFKDHLLIVPEDDANRELAIGFLLGLPHGVNAQVQRSAGGWSAARDELNNLAASMRDRPKRRVLILVDFDGEGARRDEVLRDLPDELRERVFLLGVWSNPERLQSALGHRRREEIGRALAAECLSAQHSLWTHDLLRHNADELLRLREHVLPFLR